jgi:hypothetical protein
MFPKFLTTQSLPIVAIIGQLVTTELIIFARELRDCVFAVTNGTHPPLEITKPWEPPRCGRALSF